MRPPFEPQTVSGSNAATVAEKAVVDPTRGGVPPVGPDTASMIGREILGQYTVRSKLGRGGMGTVFLAEQAGMKRQVAIKVLHPEVSRDPDAARRFKLEAEAAARLASPNIVSVFNFGQLETGELYLAMEYLQGHTLHAEIATYGRLPLARVLALVSQIAAGLDEAHRNGVIHRDLKPANVIVVPRPEGEVAKLLDFGIAKLDTGTSTQTRGWVGTPRYMAPEQFTGGVVDARTDVYALGLIAYEMLCGRAPFLSDNPMSYVHSHVYSPVPSMGTVAPGLVPPAVEAVVLAALAKAPAQRPTTAGAFAEAMVRAAHAPATARTPTSGAPVVAIVAAVLGVLAVGAGVAWAYSTLADDAPTDVDAPHSSAPSEQPVAPVAAHVPAEPSDAFEPEYVAQLPKEARELVALSEQELLERFETALEVYPPSARAQAKSQFTLQLAALGGPHNAKARRLVLIQGLVGMAAARQYMPTDERSTQALIDDYLEREGPIPKDMRQQILDSMREGVPNAEDADWTVRNWLIALEAQQRKDVEK